MFVKNPEYFLAIVKERSISKAADRLYLSQPYLSQYLAKLESNLGVTLLDRSHTPLRLTPAGELFYAYLERQDYLDRQLESDLRTLQSQKPQQLHIGVSTWRGSILLPDILPRFVQFYPEVQVVLHEAPVPQLGNLAASSVTDFCLMHIPSDLTDLSYELVMHERILLIAHRDHPLVRGLESPCDAPLPFGDLRRLEKERLMMLPEDWRLSKLLYNMFSVQSVEPVNILTTTPPPTTPLPSTWWPRIWASPSFRRAASAALPIWTASPSLPWGSPPSPAPWPWCTRKTASSPPPPAPL